MVDQLLPSRSDGAAKSAILDFVARVTMEGGPDYVPPSERIATSTMIMPTAWVIPVPTASFTSAGATRCLTRRRRGAGPWPT